MALLYNGLLLMVMGMGTVFLFLGIMVCCIQLASKVSARFAHLLPEKETGKKKKKKPPVKANAPAESAVLLTVMAAAIQKYRAERH